jgi:hypothetical protein
MHDIIRPAVVTITPQGPRSEVVEVGVNNYCERAALIKVGSLSNEKLYHIASRQTCEFYMKADKDSLTKIKPRNFYHYEDIVELINSSPEKLAIYLTGEDEDLRKLAEAIFRLRNETKK